LPDLTKAHAVRLGHAAFLTVAGFTTAGMLFAWWLPVRRI
jgi:hypothetical protein